MIETLRWGIHKLGASMVLRVLLLSSALSSIAIGLNSILRGLDVALVLTVTALGLLIGWLLAKSRLPGWLAGIIALGLGIVLIFLRVGQLGGKLITLLRTWAAFTWQTWNWPTWRRLPDAQPALQILGQFANDVATLAARLREWLFALANGTPAFDPVAVALLWSLILWMVAVWAAWAVRRHDRPFEALIPGIALLGGMLAYVGGNSGFFLPPLGALLLLMVLSSASARERQWEMNGTDFAEDIRFDLAVVSVPLSLFLIVMAAIVPSISITQIARSVQRSFASPTSDGNSLSDSLGLIPQPREKTVFDDARSPGLPRQHLLGAGPELSKKLVMIVQTVDPSTNASRYYWRTSTYEQYTGHGWLTGPTEIVEYQAGEPAISELQQTQRLVRLEIQTRGNAGGLLFATGTLITTDHDFKVAWRSRRDGDMFGANSQAKTYRVDSLVPVVSEAELRSAGSDYSAWMRARYMDLPTDIPDRIPALARDLTATAPTPYDRARAIEEFLRRIPYTLDLPAPPLNRDVVDYFLFDLKRGYCDYYATAMVVLARAAGLPARLVVGYARGAYDPTNARYIVTEADAHSWVEVYFPDYGWVEFEPTGARAGIDRPAEGLSPEKRETKIERGQSPVMQLQLNDHWWSALAYGIALFGLGLVLWLMSDGWHLRRCAPEIAIDHIYMRLYHHSNRLGLQISSSDTPGEIARQWKERIGVLAKGGGDLTWRQSDQDIQWLTSVYVLRRYSSRRPDADIQRQAIQTWGRLRLPLWSAWVLQSYRRWIKR